VLAAQGNQLVTAFDLAMTASAMICTAAAASAFILVKAAIVAEGKG
jgi:hypothetical protein